jgi:uncharacterized membrane protein YidH (DUF202 family)
MSTEPHALDGLVDAGALQADAMVEAKRAAAHRAVPIERVLVQDLGVPRAKLVDAVAARYGCPAITFDERVPVSVELLEHLDRTTARELKCFPLLTDGATTVVVAANPRDPRIAPFLDALHGAMTSKSAVSPKTSPEHHDEIWTAPGEDVDWYFQDYAHAPVGALIGTERTALAYWRNTMAHWRTRLACFRTDFATLRTALAVARFGLGMVGLADALWRRAGAGAAYWPAAMIGVGLALASWAAPRYWSLRRELRPPGHHSLVELTFATLHFIERYTPKSPSTQPPAPARSTMLTRMERRLQELLVPLDPPPTQKERAPLARERTILAGARTVKACARTLYARARTGLAFVRTGVFVLGMGAGSLAAFPSGMLSILDVLLVLVGLFFVVDGIAWYLPVRREDAALAASTVPKANTD